MSPEPGSTRPEIILPPECQTLPPVCQEAIKERWSLLRQRTDEGGPIYIARTREELNALLPEIRQHTRAFFEALEPFRKIIEEKFPRPTWEGVVATITAIDLETAQRLDRGLAWTTTRDTVRRSLFSLSGFDKFAALAVVWETVKDQEGFDTNPLAKLLPVYVLGAYQGEFRQVNGRSRIVFDFPMSEPKESPLVLACVAFGPESGDSKVNHYHLWGQDCSCIQSLDLAKAVYAESLCLPSLLFPQLRGAKNVLEVTDLDAEMYVVIASAQDTRCRLFLPNSI